MTKALFIGTDYSNDYRYENKEYGGVSYYRLIKPQKFLNQDDDWDVDYIGLPDFPEILDTTDEEALWQSYKDLFSKYDIIVTKHLDKPGAVKHVFGAAKAVDVPVVLDMDDNVMEVLDTQPSYEKGYAPGGRERVTFGVAMSMADAIFVSTEPLKEYYENFLKEAFDQEKPFFVLPNCNDSEDWHFESPKNDDKVIIGWAGSTTHDEDLAIVLPVLNKLADKYENVHLQFMGGLQPETLAQYADWSDKTLDKIEGVGGTQSWEGFPEAFMGLNWDIGIAPLTDCEFNRGKSHIKWMEYAMKGIPTVASKVYPYHEPIQGVDTINHGKTGLIATTEDNWEETLTILIDDAEKRKEIGQNAKDYVMKHWQYKYHIDKWKKALCSLI